jgi:DNA-binding transcriptional LysR family regulator
MALDVRRLRILREVGRHGSFSAAAQALGYTQPAISRQIATLEAETGTTLVWRGASGVRLTDTGELLARHAEAIVARLEEAETELRAVVGVQAGRLRLASFASAAATIVPVAIAAFRERHPAVELSVIMADPIDSLPRLRAGELDIALSHDPEHLDADGVEVIHLFDDPMYVGMHPDHPLAEAAAVDLAGLGEEQWMLGTTHSCPDSRLFLGACHRAGFEPRIAFQNDDYNAILGFVASGVGVALIPEMVARGARSDVVVKPLAGEPLARPIRILVPVGYRTHAAAAMTEILQEVSARWASETRVLAVPATP